MGLLDTTHQQYYQGNDLGNYQFVSLEDIINQFMVVYVGDQKIINKASRIDVAFHAQRALAELSFDTFKSIKAQQIVVPATLKMILPQDYVNYTKLSWSDNAGIKHPLYPTSSTSNPFQILQGDNGSYSFPSNSELVINPGFSDVNNTVPENWSILAASPDFDAANFQSSLGVNDGKLMWSYVTKLTSLPSPGWSQIGAIYQTIDVSEHTFIDISADGITSDITYTNADATTGTAVGTIRFGLTTSNPALITNLNNHPDFTHGGSAYVAAGTFYPQSPLGFETFFDKGYLEWTSAENSTKTLEGINVENLDTIYIVALSFIEASTPLTNGFALKPVNPNHATATVDTPNINSLDNLSVINTYASTSLQTTVGNETNSSTWNNYKSGTPSENQDDYQDDTYWPMDGSRFGLDPQHAQANGSFFIDQRLGKIHFSSNISGKTVILDYISDSLGTDGEMQVHKFAEEAMYRYILHGVAAGRIQTQQIVPRLKKEKFAAIRQAKLRLSDIKIEELTQILRGKSKQIKH